MTCRSLPGPCEGGNQGTLCWGPDGLLAYGCHRTVVVVEAASVQVLQSLGGHRATVCQVCWSHHVTCSSRLGLASADSAGQIITWDVSSGEVTRRLQDGNQTIQQISWVAETLLLAVHPPNHLVLWDVNTGTKVWKKSYGDTVLGFDVSPHSQETLLLRCQHSFLLTEFNREKSPKSDGKTFYMTSSRNVESAAGTQKTRSGSRSKLRRMVRSMMLGEGGDGEEERDNDSLLAIFHPGVRGQVVIGYSREILIIDMELGQAVGQINLDRSNSSLVSVRAASQQPVLFLLQESGTVSAWLLRSGLSVSATPLLTPMPGLASSLSMASLSGHTDNMLEVSYECLGLSDNIRMAKNCKVSGLALRPNTQSELAFNTTDGRLIFLNLRPLETSTLPPIVSLSALSLDNVRLGVAAVLHPLGSLSCVKMCPALTTKNWNSYRPLLAVGTQAGHLQVVNVSSGCLEREIAVHSARVQGLEWTSANPAATLLTFSHSSVTASQGSQVRNELAHVNILTGKVTQLRSDQSKEPGEARITIVKVSHTRRFFVVAFSSGPFELWDLTKLCILRTMPRKFPHISALEWSPLTSGKSRKSGSVSPEGQEGGERSKEAVREYIVMTDSEGQLYHFTVEGHTIKDGTKIPAETGLGTITSICWKSDVIVRGCTEGNVNIWNMKTRQSKNIHTGRGSVRRMAFSPGKNNLKLLVLYDNGVQIWDVKELEMINELRSPVDIVKLEDIDWASSDRVILAGTDGTVRLAGLALAGTSSPALSYGRHQDTVCPALLSSNSLRRINMILCYSQATTGQDLLTELQTGLSQDEMKIVETCFHYWSPQMLSVLLDESVSFSEKLDQISLALGLEFESEMWRTVSDISRGKSLSRKFDFLTSKKTFLTRLDEVCRLHISRGLDRRDRMRVTAQLICLGQTETAVSMLLDTDLETENYTMTDQLLACLIQATANTNTNQCESVMKMVATNLVSEGRMWEGVLLLVLIGKVRDACSYLRSAGCHEQTMLVGRCLLQDQDWAELLTKYAEHLVNTKQTRVGKYYFYSKF